MTRIIIIIIARCRSNPWLALNFFFIIFFFFFFFLIISRSVYFLTRISFPFIDSSAWYARMPVCHVLQRVNVFFSTFDQSRCISAARIFLLSLSFFLLLSHSLFSFILSFLDRQREWWSHFSSSSSSTYITTHLFFFFFSTISIFLINSTCLHIHRI